MIELLAISESVAALVNDGPLYVSIDGRWVTDWHGTARIGRVTDSSRVRLPQWSAHHGAYITHYRVTIGGKRYYGRSSPGMLIRLHPVKGESR